jgi:hypothetical protein
VARFSVSQAVARTITQQPVRTADPTWVATIHLGPALTTGSSALPGADRPPAQDCWLSQTTNERRRVAASVARMLVASLARHRLLLSDRVGDAADRHPDTPWPCGYLKHARSRPKTARRNKARATRGSDVPSAASVPLRESLVLGGGPGGEIAALASTLRAGVFFLVRS